MKQLKFNLLLCLLVLGMGNANAQSVKFTLNHIAGYQSSSNHDWAYYSNVPYGYNTNSHWGHGVNGIGNSWNVNDYLTTSGYKQFLQRYNINAYAGELFDWFSLEFKNPAYTSIKYKVIYKISTSKTKTGSTCRAALFNYNTNYSRWNGHQYTSSGYDHFRTALGARESKGEGENSVCVIKDTESGEKWIADHWVEYEIDNSEGSASTTPYYRYLGFSSSKTASSNSTAHTVKLWMYYQVMSTTYYKILTYQPGEGTTGSALTQKIASTAPETLKPASTYTRKNHIFAGWKDGYTNHVYSADITVTPSKENYGPLTLTAQWTPVQFTFKNGDATVGSTLSAQSNGSLPTLTSTNKPTSGANQFFAGYYTQEGGKGVQVYDSNLNPTTAGQALNFTANTTLYAHFISTQHAVTWDYTYRTGESSYLNLDAANHARYCRLQIRNASGVFKTVYLTAPEVTNKTTDLTSEISSHTTATTTVNFAEGNSSDNISGETATIYFSRAELESIHECDYEVWSTDGTTDGSTIEHWITETNKSANTTIFKWEGYTGENMFDLKWTVTLKGLNMYPDKIFVKPMVSTGGDYREITPMTGLIGEECERVSLVENNGKLGEGSYATYTGEYVVLNNVGIAQNVSYQVGMTGFYLNGQEYFLNPTPGSVATDFISAGTAANASNKTISYEINDYDIPVVLLLPAAPGSGITDAKVNGLSMELYVDQARATNVSLSKFKAERPHYDFTGWLDTEWNNTIWGADDVYEFHTHDVSHNGGTRTLIAQWTRSTAPEASVAMTEEANQFKYTITATDDAEVKTVKYMISAEEPTAEANGWTEVIPTDEKYVVTISHVNNDFGKYLYVMVENEGKNVIVKYNAPIRSFTNLTANPDPDSRTDDSYTYYTTYYNSEKAYKIQNATAYKVGSISDRAINLTEITTTDNDEIVLPKGEAVLLKAYVPTITLEEVDSDVQKSVDNRFEGVDEQTPQSAGYDYYIFSYAQKGLGFYLNSTNTLAAHKAFIQLENGQSAARAFTLNFGDSETTGIRDIETEVDTDALYDLSGRKVSAPSAQGGIYIKGGKKVFIKK